MKTVKHWGRWTLATWLKWTLAGAGVGFIYGAIICLAKALSGTPAFIELTACTALGVCAASVVWRGVATWRICRYGAEELCDCGAKPTGDHRHLTSRQKLSRRA